MAELVDAQDLKSCDFGRAGSIPAPGTNNTDQKVCVILFGEWTDSFARVGKRMLDRYYATQGSNRNREAVDSPRSRKTTRGEVDSRAPEGAPLGPGTMLSVVLGTLSVPQ